MPSSQDELVQALCSHYPQTNEAALKGRLERILSASREQGLSEEEIDRQLRSWNTQFSRRRSQWVSADAALADLRSLLLGPESWWAKVWKGLRRIAGVAFDHYVAVAGSIVAIGGAFYGLAYTRFYDSLDITPEQAGFAPAQILAHSVLGGVVLVALITLFFFSFFVALIPTKEKAATAGESGSWRLLVVNAVFTVAGLAVLLKLAALVDLSIDEMYPFVVLSVLFFLVGSFDFGWSGWHPTVRPSPLEITLERYMVVMIACAIPALVMTGWLTFLEAKDLGERASVGKAVRDPRIGIFPFLGVRAEPALVRWSTTQEIDSLPRCVLYLGSSGGSIVLYDHRSSSTFHIPEGDISIQLQSEMSSCEAPANLRPPSTLPFGEGKLRCEHGKWRSRVPPHFKYEWVLDGHHLEDDGTGSPWLLYERAFSEESVVYCRVWAITALGEDAAVSAPAIVGG